METRYPIEYKVGQRVKVNCFAGVVEDIITGETHTNPWSGKETYVPYWYPLYVVRMNYTREYKWAARANQVGFPMNEHGTGWRSKIRLHGDCLEPLLSGEQPIQTYPHGYAHWDEPKWKGPRKGGANGKQ